MKQFFLVTSSTAMVKSAQICPIPRKKEAWILYAFPSSVTYNANAEDHFFMASDFLHISGSMKKLVAASHHPPHLS